MGHKAADLKPPGHEQAVEWEQAGRYEEAAELEQEAADPKWETQAGRQEEAAELEEEAADPKPLCAVRQEQAAELHSYCRGKYDDSLGVDPHFAGKRWSFFLEMLGHNSRPGLFGLEMLKDCCPWFFGLLDSTFGLK